MAKGKHSGSKTSYVSNGERPSVKRSTLIALRKERRANPSLKSIFQRLEHREYVLSRKHDPKFKVLRERYIYEDSINSRATKLLDKFGSYGATWAGCVQAVKTDFVPSFESKWLARKNAQNQ